MKQPHKHAALIKAWADGAEIQIKSIDGDWFDLPNPTWAERFEYRIKPEPKPDVVRYVLVTPDRLNPRIFSYHSTCDQNNIKLTFDGETLELKAVEMIGKKA